MDYLSIKDGSLSATGLNQIVEDDTNPIYLDESLNASAFDSNGDVHVCTQNLILTISDNFLEAKWTFSR